MNRLDVISLCKDYEGKPLLHGVSFQVKSGEILCLLGSSGSGKSTILRIIAGIEKPDSGCILWNGKDLAEVPVFQRNFGLMFQDYALFPHLSVEANVAFGLKMRKFPKPEITTRVLEALARVNMTGFAERKVTDLSGGEQQRIALARALAPRPGLLMLDEPLAALDRSLRVELQEELRFLLDRSGIPAIYVTHDQEEAIMVSDRLALLNDGSIVQCDRTEDVFQHPHNRWAAEFLGMTNFIEGMVASLDPIKVRSDCGILVPGEIERDKMLQPGEKVTLLIKPTGGIQSDEESSVNKLQGEVTEVGFRGDHYRIKVKVCPNTVFEFSSASAVTPGQQITIHLSSNDVMILDD